MHVRMRTYLAVVAVIGAAMPFGSGLPAAAATERPPLPGQFLALPPGSTSLALDVSEEGTAAGSVTVAGAAPRPALWRGAGLSRLPLPDEAAGGLPPATGYAAKVEGGVAVGAAGPVEFIGMTPSGLTWRRGTPRIFATTGAVSVTADVNRAGDALIQAAGYYVSSSQVERADGTVYQTGISASALDGRGRAVGARVTGSGTNVTYEAARSDGTTVTILDAPAGKSSMVYDVAEDGTACGTSFRIVPGGGPKPTLRWIEQQPLLWRPDGTRVDLPALGSESWCSETAGGGVAAGTYVREDGTRGSVLWVGGRAYPVGPDDVPTATVGVNRRGQVALNVTDGGSATQYGVVADARAWQRLTAAGRQHTGVADINAAGVAVGSAFDTDDVGNPVGQRATRWLAPLTPPAAAHNRSG
jgi:hypothetical protein